VALDGRRKSGRPRGALGLGPGKKVGVVPEGKKVGVCCLGLVYWKNVGVVRLLPLDGVCRRDADGGRLKKVGVFPRELIT